MKETRVKKPLIDRALSGIERVGNKLPDPATIFVILCVLVVLISALCSAAGVSVVHPGTGETVSVMNLLSAEGLKKMISEGVSNFANFAPMAMILVVVIGSGVAEKSGFLSSLMQKLVRGASPKLVTAIVIFVGINANLVGDAGFVVLPPLAAMIYLGLGRHPLIGLFTAYASVAGGFCASLFLGMFEMQGAGFTTVAAQMLDPEASYAPTMNWYFMIVSCFVLTAVGTFVTEKLVAPKFQDADLSVFTAEAVPETLSNQQSKSLRPAILSVLITVAVIIFLSVGDNALLADAETGQLLVSNAPFMKGLILIITIIMFVPGAVFGFASGRYRNDKDLFADSTAALRDMAPYILLCFFGAQFLNYFTWSNLGTVLAVNGADFLESINLTGIPLMLCMVLMVAFLNLFMGSASAKYAILAPIIVPMLMLLDISPAMAQVLYRIGDSITNPLSPLFSYFPILLGYTRRYDKNAGMGTMIANMLPFSVAFFLAWVVMIIVWCLFDLPLGPGASVFLQ